MKKNSVSTSFSAVLILAGLVVVLCGFDVHESKPWPMRVLATAAPVYDADAPFDGKQRFPQGAHLLLLEGTEHRILLPSFFASADANLSYQADKILFAGKRSATDAWQIYESSLDGKQWRALTHAAEDCIRPYSLPDRRFVAACRVQGAFQIRVASLDAPDKATVITHVPGPMIPDGILRDGRILFEAASPLGTRGKIELYTVYPDGSGVEAYRNDAGENHRAAVELPSGDLLMAGDSGARLFTDTAADAVPLDRPAEALRGDDRGGFAVVDAQSWITSWRPRAQARAKYSLAWIEKGMSQQAPCEAHAHCIEPVVVRPRPYEKEFPSALHPWSYAHLLTLNSTIAQEGDLPAGLIAKVRVRALDEHGRATVLGTAPVENDGSFYLRVPGNTALQMALMDRTGKILRQEKGWMWTASGEQRICVGCHAGPQRAPDNAVPAVLRRSTEPTDLSLSPAGK
jgi:hypothetical protein